MEIENNNLMAGFSLDGENFFINPKENKTKVWNVQKGKFVEISLETHVFSSPTAMDISNNLDNGKVLLAVGSAEGKVHIFDTASLKVIMSFHKHSGEIYDVKFSEGGQYLYSVSADKYIIKYDLGLKEAVDSYEYSKKSGSLNQARIQTVNSESQLLVTLNEKAFIIDITQKTIVNKFSGHSKPVVSLSKSKNSKIFSTYSNEGFINLFNYKQKVPFFSIQLLKNEQLLHQDITTLQKKNYLVIAQYATTIDLFIVSGGESPNILQEHSVELTKAEFFSSMFDFNRNLHLAAGKAVTPSFKVVNSYLDESLDGKSLDAEKLNRQILMLDDSKKLTKKGQNKQQGTEDKAYIVGETENVPKKLTGLNPELKEKTDQIIKNKAVYKIIDKMKESMTPGQLEEELTSEQSLSALLLQALHNNDTELLDFCLDKDDEELIENTVRKLLASKVLPLLDRCVERINTFPHRARTLVKWLKYILRHHSSLLITTPNINEKLSPLLGVLQNKTQNISNLIQLKGKIDMCIKSKQPAPSSKKGKIEPLKPLFVYEEGDTELNLVEERKPKKPLGLKKGDFEKEEKEFSDSVSESGDEDELREEEDVDEEFDEAMKYNNIEDEEEEDDEDSEEALDEFMEI